MKQRRRQMKQKTDAALQEMMRMQQFMMQALENPQELLTGPKDKQEMAKNRNRLSLQRQIK
jgi:hypothetical protein